MGQFYKYSNMENKIRKFSKQLNKGINCEWKSVSMKEVLRGYDPHILQIW